MTNQDDGLSFNVASSTPMAGGYAPGGVMGTQNVPMNTALKDSPRGGHQAVALAVAICFTGGLVALRGKI